MKIRMLVYIGDGNYSLTSSSFVFSSNFFHSSLTNPKYSSASTTWLVREWALEQIDYSYEEVL